MRGRNYEWTRISEMRVSKTLWDRDIDPHDVNQGELGDCYFLAFCSSMAEQPDRIRDLFITKEYNDVGIYLLKLWVNGKETLVLIDDFLPSK